MSPMRATWEILRAVLQGLALWWYGHQHIPREQVVATAMTVIWVGFDRARDGDTWQPTAAGPSLQESDAANN